MTATAGGNGRARLMTRMVEHGATQVAMADLMDQAQIVWRIGANDSVSETCIHAEEIMASGARSCRSALDVMARMQRTEGAQDRRPNNCAEEVRGGHVRGDQAS